MRAARGAMRVKYYAAAQVANGLSYPELIARLKLAFQEDTTQPPRNHYCLSTLNKPAEMLIMPAWNQRAVAVKILTLFEQNSTDGLPVIQGVVVAFDPVRGQPMAIIDAPELTARRTAAASALASSYLSRTDASHLLIIGTGNLVPYLAQAHAVVRPLRRISIYGRDSRKAKETVQNVARVVGSKIEVALARELSKSAREAQVITTATRSLDPVICYRWLSPGVHLNLVGGYRPDMREADAETIVNASLFADTRQGVLLEAGDITQPVSKGLITEQDIRADLFDLSRGRHVGRTGEDEITLFKSVGAALEDLAAISLLFDHFGLDAQ